MVNDEIRQFLLEDVRERFLRYVQVFTTSDPASTSSPSTERQWDLLRVLEAECKELGLTDVSTGESGCVYATLPARCDTRCAPFGLLAHVDTSPEQPGDGVRPVRHENWDGSSITFADDPDLTLDVAGCDELRHFVGDTIITASGLTLLGADDKAGVAEIMAALATLQHFPQLVHGEIRACFTSDEEIGRGTDGLDLTKLPHYCYTMDGSFPGELEDECFDAWGVKATFTGIGVHPGFAKDKLVNASTCMARFLSELPEEETPECTEGDQGFYYVAHVEGGCENAHMELIVRDFDAAKNQERLATLERLKNAYEERFPGLSIDLKVNEQYRNMREVLKDHPHLVELARKAIEDTGLKVLQQSIRGGTDGSRLCELGHPTPNIFAGGMLFHSRREWIAESALAQAAETIVHLARRWTEVAG